MADLRGDARASPAAAAPTIQFTPDAVSDVRSERVARADHDLRRVGLDLEHVERLGRRQAEPLRWPTVKRCTPSCVPSDAAVVVDDRAGARRVRAPARSTNAA